MAMFSTNWQPGVSKFKFGSLRNHADQNKNRHSDMELTFQSRTYNSSIVFQRIKYVNLLFSKYLQTYDGVLYFNTVNNYILTRYH